MSNPNEAPATTATTINKYPGTLIHFMYDDPAQAEAAYAEVLKVIKSNSKKRSAKKRKAKSENTSSVSLLDKFF